MGMFSKVCSKTYLPVIHHGYGADWHNLFPDFYEVIAMYPDGTKIEGFYDGYGRIGSHEVAFEDWDKVKFVLKKHYAGETYKQLGKTYDELAQGHFMSVDFIKYCQDEKPSGFKNFKEYERAFKKLAQW